MGNMKIGRTLITVGFGILLLLFAWEVFAADDSIRIIEVRRNIPLADTDPVYRDYYINAGLDAGLKPNQVVVAVRKVNAKDAAGTLSFGELLIPVGQLKIIFAQSRIAVAREYKLLGREDLPMLEQIGVLIGDQIDLKGSFIDNRRSSAKTSAQKEKATDAPAEPAPAVAGTEAKPVETAKPATAPAVEPKPAPDAASAEKAKPAEPTRENASVPSAAVAKPEPAPVKTASNQAAPEKVAEKHE